MASWKPSRDRIGRMLRAAMVGGGAALLLGGCGVLDHGVLAAAGPVAAHERRLFLLTCGVLVFVAAPVLILTPLFAWHYRLSNTRAAYRPRWDFSWPLEALVWIPPAGIVVLLAVLLWPATHLDDPYTRLRDRGAPIRIQAIGLDWKWVFVYPDLGIATADQIAVPVGRPIEVELTSGTVMQSMLLPRLSGQIYAMAGMRTKLNFAADRAGRYLGENTQYSGGGFPRQRFTILAMPGAGYEAWLSRVRGAGRPLDAAGWRDLSRRAPLAAPRFFSAVPPRFFDAVVIAGGGGHAMTRNAR